MSAPDLQPAAPGPVPAAAVLDLFALLFSDTWINAWKQLWKQSPDKALENASALPPQTAKRPFYERIFSLRVTLWYLVFQRLHGQASLGAVVADLRAGRADRLSPHGGLKLSEKVRSASTSAYNQARQRLPLALLQAAMAHFGASLRELVGCSSKSKPAPHQRLRLLLDGSTIAMIATPALCAVFAPARNQNGVTDWCLMRILVGFCARSGAVLSAMAAPVCQCEQVLAWKLIEQAQIFTLWVGDRNFGVWSVAAQARRYGQEVLVRMSKTRAHRLCAGIPLRSGEDRPVEWKPTRFDQSAPGTERTTCCGRLLYLRLPKNGRFIDVWLFTSLDAQEYPFELLMRWYGQRWQAELNFRSLKTEMKMSELDVSTPEMAEKEFYAGLLAYSFVRAVMWAAGGRLEEAKETLSFSAAKIALRMWLEDWAKATMAAATDGQSLQALLQEIALGRLPKRKRPRPSEIRRVRHRRQKFPPFKGSRAAARVRYAKSL
jgi:hypothetical protein